MKRLFVLLMGFFVFGVCFANAQNMTSNLMVQSTAFQYNGEIPERYTCDGQSMSPMLMVQNIPMGAKSLALIMDDPDAPRGAYTHWLVYDIPPNASFMEGSAPGRQGINSAFQQNYSAPCPPSGTHRYYFKVYALDTMLNLAKPPNTAELMKAMEGHILATGELMGTYKRTR